MVRMHSSTIGCLSISLVFFSVYSIVSQSAALISFRNLNNNNNNASSSVDFPVPPSLRVYKSNFIPKRHRERVKTTPHSPPPDLLAGVSKLRIPFQQSLSACLLIKDDNKILDEWLAYHYWSLDLRYVVVAVDPNSVTSPLDILAKWQNYTDLQIQVWNDTDFMPESFLNNHQNAVVVPRRFVKMNVSTSKWHQGNEDPEQILADLRHIGNHRYRQVVFIGACFRHMKRENRTYVVHIDTDEYVVINPTRRNHPIDDKFGMPASHEQSSVATLLRKVQQTPLLRKNANLPCLSMPRVFYGSVEDQTRNVSRRLNLSLSSATSFESTRWIYHAAFDDKERNGYPKVIVDVSRVNSSDQLFSELPFSIHRPSKRLCRTTKIVNVDNYERYPVTTNHYIGTFERYNARNDTRRSDRAYNAKAHVKDGRDDWIVSWMDGFVDKVGDRTAAFLLGRTIS